MEIEWRRAAVYVVCRDSALGTAGHLVGIVYEATEVRGELRTTFDPGTTDAVRWFDRDEIARLRRIPMVDAVLANLP